MRISYWSSDVCSSDLEERPWRCASSNQSSVAPQQLHPILSSARSSSSAELWEGKRSRSICSDCSILLRSSILGSSQLRSFLTSSMQRASVRSFLDLCRCSSARRGSEEHTSELKSLMRISYAVFCLEKKNTN